MLCNIFSQELSSRPQPRHLGGMEVYRRMIKQYWTAKLVMGTFRWHGRILPLLLSLFLFLLLKVHNITKDHWATASGVVAVIRKFLPLFTNMECDEWGPNEAVHTDLRFDERFSFFGLDVVSRGMHLLLPNIMHINNSIGCARPQTLILCNHGKYKYSRTNVIFFCVITMTSAPMPVRP
jgi:hypothetical protein